MKREAKELNNLIEQVSQKVVNKVVNEKYLVSRMAVIVNEFDPNTNSASIIIPTDLSNHTDYKYPNRTGITSLRSTVWENGQIKTYGDKVYLVYQSNNISQGWLESNKSLDIVKEVSRDYLTKADAANTYETKENANATYETKTHAAATYETKTNAAATYETKTDASNTYVKKSGDTMTGALNIKASGWNARASAIDTVHNGELDLAFNTDHKDHGLYSTGYSADGTTWTNEGKWIIHRGPSGGVGINGNTLLLANNGNATFSGNINASGNIRAEGYVSLGGNVYADGGDIHAGTTTKARAANNGVHSVAGKIYLHTEGTTSGKRGLLVSNRNNTYKEIISVDQNNVATFYGKVNGLVDMVYPVGSIYMSVNSTSPATLFGGTWVQLKDRFLLGRGSTYSNGATGGEATHKLTVNEMPKHTHSIYYYLSSGSLSFGYNFSNKGAVSAVTVDSSGIGITGGDVAHNNMPPYLVVYMWKRTA